MLKASPSTLQAMRGASPLQVVTSTRGSFMYPVRGAAGRFNKTQASSAMQKGAKNEPQRAQSWSRRTAITSWQNRKNSGTCRRALVSECEGERFAAKPAYLDRVENPLYAEFRSVSVDPSHINFLSSMIAPCSP